MNYYNQIVGLNEKELTKKVKRKINKLERKSRKNNPDFNVLGYHVGENNEKQELYDTDKGPSFDLELRCFYNSYIRKGSKMVYGLVYDLQGNVANTGNYYYIDEDDYILEFCKFVQDKEIESEFELIDYIHEFCKNYYGRIKQQDRNDMFKLIHKSDNEYYTPIKEHSIKDFKGKGSAMCTEYSVMAQNIMRFFDIESYLVIGTERVGNSYPESHAYNLARVRDGEEEINVLIDFTNYVNVYDLDFKKIGESPFVGEIAEIDEDLVEGLIFGEEHLVFDDYAYYVIGDTQAKLGYERERDYYVDTYLKPEQDIANELTRKR